MTSNWDWNRRDGGDEGAQSDPNSTPTEGEQAGEQTPPWGPPAETGDPQSAESASQAPWERPGDAAPTAGYNQTPWDRPGNPSATGADQGYTQTPWDRPQSGGAPTGNAQAPTNPATPWGRPESSASGSASGGSATSSFGYGSPSQAETPSQPSAPGGAYGNYGTPGAAYSTPSDPGSYAQANPQNQPNPGQGYGQGPQNQPNPGQGYGQGPQNQPNPGQGYGAGYPSAPYAGAPYGGQQNPNAPYGTAAYGAPQYGTTPAYPNAPYGVQGYGFGGPQAPMRPRMSFMQAMTAWVQNYARFNGRAGLSEYWWTVLGNVVVVLVLDLLLTTAGRSADGSTNGLGTIVSILLGIWGLATIIPNLAITVRRLHDTNRSGWTYLYSLIPLVGGIIVLVFTLGGSNPEGARFDGPDQPRTGE